MKVEVEVWDDEQGIDWVVLPNNEPGITLALYDKFAEPTESKSDAYVIVALDRFVREWQFHKEFNTFDTPRFH